jgi:hypothetical protein
VSREEEKIALSDCLQSYTKEEILGARDCALSLSNVPPARCKLRAQL